MNKSFCSAVLCAIATIMAWSVASGAPVVTDNARVDFPPGITIEAESTVQATRTLTAATFSFRGRASAMRSAATAFRAALLAAGVTKNRITIAYPGEVRVETEPESFGRIFALARSSHAYYNDDAVSVPADFEATYRDALRQVVEIARARAAVIAAASNQHVGRLLSFQPGPIGLAREAISIGNPVAMLVRSDEGGAVTADGLVTFEVLP